MTHSPARAGLQTLFDDHYASLVRLAAVLLDDVGECEDVVQDAFVGLLRVERKPRAGKEAAYLRSAVLNGARSRLRRRLVRHRHPQPAPDPARAAADQALEHIEMQRVLAAVRELPRRQAEVLLLRYHADLTEAEIADTLGISPGSVKTHASRGLASLRAALEEDT